MNGILQVEVGRECGEVVGIMVHVVTITDLARPAVAAPVMSDDAKTLADEEEHLRIPVVRGKRPAVAKNDRLTRPPVLVEDLNAVLGGDRAHRRPLLRVCSMLLSAPPVARAPREQSSCRDDICNLRYGGCRLASLLRAAPAAVREGRLLRLEATRELRNVNRCSVLFALLFNELLGSVDFGPQDACGADVHPACWKST